MLKISPFADKKFTSWRGWCQQPWQLWPSWPWTWRPAPTLPWRSTTLYMATTTAVEAALEARLHKPPIGRLMRMPQSSGSVSWSSSSVFSAWLAMCWTWLFWHADVCCPVWTGWRSPPRMVSSPLQRLICCSAYLYCHTATWLSMCMWVRQMTCTGSTTECTASVSSTSFWWSAHGSLSAWPSTGK